MPREAVLHVLLSHSVSNRHLFTVTSLHLPPEPYSRLILLTAFASSVSWLWRYLEVVARFL